MIILREINKNSVGKCVKTGQMSLNKKFND